MSQDPNEVREVVRETYARAAQSVLGGRSSCCDCSPLKTVDPITNNLYDAAQLDGLPAAAAQASLGCGNPTSRAGLQPGQVVLDLGSGGGIDVLLSARQVGPAGKVYGLDMTDEMLELARANQKQAGVENAEFLKGHIEKIPLAEGTVDVILSNCVVNLSGDKDAVLQESFRVLKSGGRLAISDIVVRGEMPAEIRRNMELWSGCVAGALTEADYRARLEQAGFHDVKLTPTRIYGEGDVRQLLSGQADASEATIALAADKFMSAFIEGIRP